MMFLLLVALPAVSDTAKTAPQVVAESKYVAVVEEITVAVPINTFSKVLLETPLEEVLHSSNGIPDVVGTVNLTGDFGAVGSRRIVKLSDGSQATEQVRARETRYFAYVVWDVTNTLGRVSDHIHGEWWWSEGPNNTTKVKWRYSIRPKNGLVRPLVAAFVRPRIRKFLHQTLVNYKALAETGRVPKAKPWKGSAR